MKKKRILVWLLMLSLLLPLPGMTNIVHAESTPTPPSPPNLTAFVNPEDPNHLIMESGGWPPDNWLHEWRLSSNPGMTNIVQLNHTDEHMNSMSLGSFIGEILYLATRYVYDLNSSITSGWSKVYSVEIDDNGEIINVEPYDPEGGGYTGHVCDMQPYTILQPTCTENGLKCKRCTICHTELPGSREEIPAEHDMVHIKALQYATCTLPDIGLLRCSRCGFEESRILHEPYGHDFTRVSENPEDWERYDCVNGGQVRFLCDDCGLQGDWRDWPPLGAHTWILPFITTLEPTCTTKGQGYYACRYCPARDIEEIPMLDHEYERKVKTQPTCTEAGLSVEVCINGCGHEKEGSEQTIEPTGHDLERKVKVPAKCLEYGKSIMACKNCPYEDPTTEQDINPPGHSWEDRITQEPTCTEKGWTRKYCTVCDAEGDEGLVDALGHDIVDDGDKDPTCTEWGWIRGHCSRCDYTQQLDLEPHGHDWEDVKTIREPNCKDAGVKLVRCRICNEEKEEAIPTNDVHDLVEEVSVEPTCTEWGKYRVYCKICGFETVKGDKPPNGHTEVPIEDRAFNCMQGGMVGATKCSVCGEILNQGVYRPAIGHHTWAQKVIEPSTCQKAGSYRRTCTVCSAEEIVPLPLAEHTWIRGQIMQEPNCLREGYATTICLACGAYGEFEIFPKTYDHHWVTHPGKEPTCTKPGYSESISCDICGEIQKRVEPIPPAPHKEVTIHAMRPTATLEGRTEGIRCGRCGVWIVPCKTLPKLGSEGTEHNMTKEPPPLTQGSDESASFTSDADFQDFSHVTVDDKIVDPSNYDAREGSTIITFKPAFLKTLSVGKHKVKIVSASGSAHGVLEIKAKTTQKTSDTTPKTGDGSGQYLWLALLLLSAGGLIFLACNKKRILKQRD